MSLPSPTFDLSVGRVLSGRYRLERPIGEGGMGVVWAATHVITRGPVALKFLKVTGDEHVKRFLREARIAGTLRHPNVVDVHDVLQLPDATPVMVMDLLSGESLAERLDRGPIALPELAGILLPVLGAVSAAHALGIVHRDLKPENIFLAASPAGTVDVKVLDFGIAKLTAHEGEAAQTAGLTNTGAVMGTPYYMAPEQVFGERTIDHRADIWALGCILYECLSGRKPIVGENFGQIFKAITMEQVTPLATIAPGVDGDVARLVGRMLTPNRDARPDLQEVQTLLALHTSVRAPFTPPRISVEAPASAPADPLAATAMPADPPAATTATYVDPLAATTATPTNLSAATIPKGPRRSRALVAGLALACVAAVALTGFRVLRMKPAASFQPAALAVTSNAPMTAPRDPEPTPPPEPAPAETSTPPTTAGSRSALVTAAPPRPRVRSAPPAEPTASAPAAAKKLPGGVHRESPY